MVTPSYTWRLGLHAFDLDAAGHDTFGGTGGRPPYDYVVAASDSDVDLQAIADAVCDGTADQVEINAAIAAMVAASRPYTVLILPGSYNIAAAVDFTGLTAKGGIWNVFEASGTTWKASANMTTMVKLDPGAGGQIVTCLDLRLGKLDGDKGSRTVGELINMARFNDNIVRVEDIYNGSGDGLKVSMNGVGDYPNGNNRIDIEIIRNCSGTGFYVTGNAHPDPYGFQGNSVHIGEIIANGNGVILGATVNDNCSWNAWYLGVVEHNTNAGIYDYAGGNVFIVANTNGNGTYGIGGPSSTFTYRSVFVGTFLDTIASPMIDQHFIQNNGSFQGIVELAERSSAVATPPSGFGRFYSKNDGTVHWVNDSGTDFDLTTGGSAAPSTADYLVGTAQAGLSAEIVVGTTPGGELGGTWSSPTVDTTHSGSSHADAIATAEAYTDAAIAAAAPAGAHAHVASETHLSDGSTTSYTLDQAFEPGSVIAWNVTTLARLTVTEAAPDQATVSAAGSAGDSIVFDYAASIA